MRKFILGLALAAVGLLPGSSAASAATIQEPVGTPGVATGHLDYAANIYILRCDLMLAGEVASSDVFRVDTGSAHCNAGGLTLIDFPWPMAFDALGPGTWDAQQIRWVLSLPLFGECTYSGALGGAWSSSGGLTTLTIIDVLSGVRKESGSFACSDSPTVGGVLTVDPLNVV